MSLPYAVRRKLLNQLTGQGASWSVTPSRVGDGQTMLRAFRRIGGVVQRVRRHQHLPHLADASSSSVHLLTKAGCFFNCHRGYLECELGDGRARNCVLQYPLSAT